MRRVSFVHGTLRWPRYRLGTLFAVMTLVCVALGVWVGRERRYQDRLAAMTVLDEETWLLGAYVDNGYPVDGFPNGSWEPVRADPYLRQERRLERDDALVYASDWDTGLNGLSDREVAALMRFPELRVLEFSVSDAGWQISEAQVERISSLAYLEKLDLSRAAIRDDDLRHLTNLRQLRILNLNETGVSGKAFESFTSLHKLEHLELEKSAVTDDGIHHLSSLPSLRVLCLSGTGITDEGVRHLAALRSLRVICLARTQVTGAGLAALVPLQNLEALYLDRTAVDDDAVRNLAALGSLRTLTLDATNISGASLASLSLLTSIETLYLRDNDIGDERLHELAQLPRLRFLVIDGTRVSDEGLKTLSRLTSLTDLSLRRCQSISDTGLVYLACAPKLRAVELDDAELVTAAGVAELKRLKSGLYVGWSEPVRRERPNGLKE